MAIKPGAHAEVEHVVGSADTALAHGSGDVEVLATPAVVALCERAAVAALRDHLDAATTSVGVRVSLDHVAPTCVGRRVVARARLESVDGRTLEFSVEVTDGAGVVGRGLHVRVLVDREPFLDAARSRS